jgi:hypothetical protein
MSEVMKIFLGANQYGADFPELDRLRKESEKSGFHSFRHWIDVCETLGDYGLRGKRAVLRGAYTGICVAHVTDFMLVHDIEKITIDLPNCRYDVGDVSNNFKSFEKRYLDLMLGIKPEKRNDQRINFLPEIDFNLSEILTRAKK